MFKEGKVYVAVDEEGRPIVDRGLVRIRYRKDDDREYSARADRVEEIDESKLAAARKKKKKKGAAAAPKPAGPRAPAGGFVDSSAPAPARIVGADDVTDDDIVVYTDGACFENPGPMGVGVVLSWRDNRREISRFLGTGTNNLAELHAVRIALESIRDRHLPVRIFSDSSYVIGLLARGWKAKENREVVADLRSLLATFADVAFVKVKGHAGVELNERVDELAKRAAEKGR